MAHGKKKWIRDWRGRIKRSRHRTQQDWQAELATDACISRISRRKCPQCTFLNKDRPHRGLTVKLDLGSILVPWDASYHMIEEHPHTRALRRTFGRYVHWYNGGIDWTRQHVRYYVHLTCAAMHELNVHLAEAQKLGGRAAGKISVISYPSIECDACRRKYEIAWRLWHAGGERRRRWHSSRSYTEARRDEERCRKAEIRNLMQRARYDEDLYDLIPTKVTRGWLD